MNNKKDLNEQQQKQDFSEMILSETLSVRIDSDTEVFEAYSNLMWKGIFEIRNKLLNIPNIDIKQAILTGINLIDNLFWFIYNYSFNLQLTVFLTERGKLLFTEFLFMSRTHHLMKQIDKYPSIQDAFHFSIKRSIGSLSCSGKTKKNANYITNIQEKRAFYKNLFKNIITKIEEESFNTFVMDFCIAHLQKKIVTTIDSNLKTFNKIILSDPIKSLNFKGFLFLICILSNNHIREHDDNHIHTKIGIFISDNLENLNNVNTPEFENKAHYLIINWEKEVLN